MTSTDILLVEDDADLAALMLLGFEASGFSGALELARTGIEAVGRLHSRSPLPRVVLLDLDLPGLHGLDVLRRLRDHPRTATLPVVILTASIDEAQLRDAYLAGASSFVRKPRCFDELARVLGQMWRYWLQVNERQVPGDGGG